MSTITVYRKTDNTFTVTITDGDGAAVDITGWTVYFSVNQLDSDNVSTELIKKTVTSHTTPASGVTIIEVSESDTTLSPGRYHYDVTSVDAGGRRVTYQAGDFLVLQNITGSTV